MVDRNDMGLPRRSRKLWILPAILIVLLVVFSLYGLGGGLGESVGIEEAAPGDTNSSQNPASDVDG